MKPYVHANNSVKKYGGVVEDYIEIHNFFDSSKSTFADVRHRALLHNAFGIFLSERMFGFDAKMLGELKVKYEWSDDEIKDIQKLFISSRSGNNTRIINSDNKVVQIRDLGEDHVLEDMRFIPSTSHFLENMKIQEWMGGRKVARKRIMKFD